MSTFARLSTALLIALLGYTFAAQAASGSGIPVKRDILVFYDGAREETVKESWAHRFAELPLNHLGYVLHFRDVRQPLPDLNETAHYAAVLTWFRVPIGNPAPYLDWLAGAAARGLRLIILGEVGGNVWGGDLKRVNRVLNLMGLHHTGTASIATSGAQVVFQDHSLIGYERPLDPVLPPFPILRALNSDVHVALELQASKLDGAERSAIAIVGPKGGYVDSDFVLFDQPDHLRTSRDESHQVAWIINPFQFFRKALGRPLMPAPDVTTVSGRRLYFSHIDGDALNNLAQFAPYLNPPATAAQVMLQELIRPYPDLPVTFALVVGDVDPDMVGSDASRDVVRQILALPQVEIGSHTYTHPFQWEFFRSYSREAELHLINTQAVSRNKAQTIGLAADDDKSVKNKYIATVLGMPRAYMFKPFSVSDEIDKAIALTEQLAPPGKKVKLYQWSGDTTPYESFIEATRRAGLRNINGGDSRFDINFPSIAFVAPISRQVGSQRQIYAVNSNENTYTNEWTGPFFLFGKLSETLQRTEKPRRLKGYNLYYHTYSAEKKVSMEGLRVHLTRARHGRYAPIAASHYAAIADSFFHTEILALGPRRWRIRNRGALQTVRFDDADRLRVDFRASSGVVGQNRHEGSLYVALDAATPEAVIDLTDVTQARTLAQSATTLVRPYLVESRWRVESLVVPDPLRSQAANFSFQAQGYGDGVFVWKGVAMAAGPCRISAERETVPLWRGTAEVDTNGQLAFSIKTAAIEPVTVTVLCDPGDRAKTDAGRR